jgi:DNA-binding GntR family transcriptional regulator
MLANGRELVDVAALDRAPSDDEIYSRISTSIVEHDLPPGTKVPEDTAAEAFGVSRTRIRKILQQLAHEGLLVLERHRGASVARPSAKEARDVFEVRRMLEIATMARLAEGVPARHLARLGQLLADERGAYDRGDRRSAIRLSGQFHLELIGLTGNEALHAMMRQLVSRTSLILAVYAPTGGPICLCDEHAQLIEAIRRKDAPAATAAMAHHLGHIEATLRLAGDTEAAIDLKAVFARAGARHSQDAP